MPVPPKSPNELTTFALPPDSFKTTTPFPFLSLSSFTYISPLVLTAIWRFLPTFSAITTEVKPDGSLSVTSSAPRRLTFVESLPIAQFAAIEIAVTNIIFTATDFISLRFTGR